MRFQIKTKVGQDYKKVFQGFTKDLFLKLAPPFPPVKLLRFDGCKTNDKVVLELNFLVFKETWESVITDQKTDAKEIYFIDEGVKLPFFLKYWKHKHRILKDNHQAIIIDDITFQTPFFLFDYLLSPQLYLQFLYRKPIYKRIFKAK